MKTKKTTHLKTLVKARDGAQSKKGTTRSKAHADLNELLSGILTNPHAD